MLTKLLRIPETVRGGGGASRNHFEYFKTRGMSLFFPSSSTVNLPSNLKSIIIIVIFSCEIYYKRYCLVGLLISECLSRA